MSYLAGLSLVAVSLTGCPLDEPPSVNGDQGVACTEEYWPVCGVDGVTYGNGCLAEAAGVTVAFTGACDDTELTPCGGVYGNTCADDEYCDVAVGFDYDPAHRQTAVYDNLGNRIEYTLDNAGNRTAENVIRLLPPFVITEAELDEGLARLDQALTDITA